MNEECVPVCSPAYRERENIRTPAGPDPGHAAAAEHAPDRLGRMVRGRGVEVGNPLRGPRFEQFAMVAQAAAAGLGRR